jgi:hypothetical protein
VEPVLYVMAILGCGESDAACREVRIAEQSYRSEAACMAATEDALMRADDLVFPSIVARCRPAGARVQPLRGSDVMLPPPATGQRPPRFAAARGAISFR